MAPQIASWEDMLWVSEEVHEDAPYFQRTTFAAVEDDKIYYGQLEKRKEDIALRDASCSLVRIADKEIFPVWSEDLDLTKAPENLESDVFVKRPSVALYDVFSKHKVTHLLAKGLIEEAQALEVLARRPHPNIVRYHGCRVRRGHITGIVLDRHLRDLNDHLKDGYVVEDKEGFMVSLESAIRHMHSLGWAHNDLNPANIVLTREGRPILIDFDSARRIGEELSSRGTKGWIDCEMDDYTTSEARHDISALNKLRTWLYNPSFDE